VLETYVSQLGSGACAERVVTAVRVIEQVLSCACYDLAPEREAQPNGRPDDVRTPRVYTRRDEHEVGEAERDQAAYRAADVTRVARCDEDDVILVRVGYLGALGDLGDASHLSVTP